MLGATGRARQYPAGGAPGEASCVCTRCSACHTGRCVRPGPSCDAPGDPSRPPVDQPTEIAIRSPTASKKFEQCTWSLPYWQWTNASWNLIHIPMYIQYNAFSLYENRVKENMNRESCNPGRAAPISWYPAESAVSSNENALYISSKTEHVLQSSAHQFWTPLIMSPLRRWIQLRRLVKRFLEQFLCRTQEYSSWESCHFTSTTVFPPALSTGFGVPATLRIDASRRHGGTAWLWSWWGRRVVTQINSALPLARRKNVSRRCADLWCEPWSLRVCGLSPFSGMFAGLVGLRGAQYSTTIKISLRTRVLRAWFHL